MIIKYLFGFSKLPTDPAELKKLADRLGVSTYKTGDRSVDPAMIQERILATLAYRLHGSTWIIALVSAIASVVSAVPAWIAVSAR